MGEVGVAYAACLICDSNYHKKVRLEHRKSHTHFPHHIFCKYTATTFKQNSWDKSCRLLYLQLHVLHAVQISVIIQGVKDKKEYFITLFNSVKPEFSKTICRES